MTAPVHESSSHDVRERPQSAVAVPHESPRRIGDVARLLGHSDPADITRAFQRWTGTTPARCSASAGRGQARR